MAGETEAPIDRWQTSTAPSSSGSEVEAPASLPASLLGGRFRVERRLAHGGMGVVLEATDQELGHPVAIKLLRPQLSSSPEAVERLRREVLLARRITHPNVCRVFRLFVDHAGGAARVFLTMALANIKARKGDFSRAAVLLGGGPARCSAARASCSPCRTRCSPRSSTRCWGPSRPRSVAGWRRPARSDPQTS